MIVSTRMLHFYCSIGDVAATFPVTTVLFFNFTVSSVTGAFSFPNSLCVIDCLGTFQPSFLLAHRLQPSMH